MDNSGYSVWEETTLPTGEADSKMNNPASNFGATPAGGVYEGEPHGSADDPYALIAELAKALKAVLAIAEGKTGVRLYPKDVRLVAAHSALKKANEATK